jgi:hypothetical protein
MLASVGEWVASVYAGQVLSSTEKMVASLRDKSGVIDFQIEEMKASFDLCVKDIKALKPDKTLRYSVWSPGANLIGVRRADGWWDPEGQAIVHTDKPDPGYVPIYEIGRGARRLDFIYSPYHLDAEGAIQQVQETLQNGINQMMKLRQRVSDRTPELEDPRKRAELVELILLQRECLKYTSAAKNYTTKARKKFPIDLTGWKYIQPNAPIIKRVNEKAVEPIGPLEVEKALATEGWDEILVQLDFKGHKKTLGTWRPFDRTLTVDIRGQRPDRVRHFKESLTDILRTTRHELQHLGQDVLTRVLGLKQEAGTPSQDIRVPSPPGKKPSERKEHALREEEFYTRLSDEIDRFVAHIVKQPKETWNRQFRSWVGQGGTDGGFRFDHEFFKRLKVHEPLKWQKAVKEFLKGINARGIMI